MRVLRITICLLLVYLLVPASGGLTADLVHLLDSGHTRHADAASPDHAAGDGDEQGAHGDPGPEHGCSGPYHHCPCHSTLSFATSPPLRQPEPRPVLETGAGLGHDCALGAEHRREVERPPSA